MRKKSERRYTPITSMRHLGEKLKEFGDKTLYRYFGANRTLCEMTFSEFSDMIRTVSAGFSALGLQGKRIALIGETSPEWTSS